MIAHDPRHYAKVYVDLDGVLVDFDSGYDELVGGSALRLSSPTDEAFWAPIIASPDFWINLKPMPGAIVLWRYLTLQFDHVTILSSPGSHDTAKAISQKAAWVHNYLGPRANVVFKQAKEKHFYACPRSILIDDWEKNLVRWREAGGYAIGHKDVETTFAALKSLLDHMVWVHPMKVAE